LQAAKLLACQATGLPIGLLITMKPTLPARSPRNRGNATLETGLMLLPFLMILFAVIDFNLVIFVRNTLIHSVREGVRYAVTYQTMPGLGHDASIKSVVQSNSMGFLSGTSGLAKISVKYYRQSDLTEVAANLPGHIVEVKVNDFRWSWISQWFSAGSSASISVAADDRMEALPTGGLPPVR
jgi:hypothetical protein